MTRPIFAPLLAVSILLPASAETLLFWDNFNTGLGQLALDSAPLDGRRSGTEPHLQVRSSQVQQVSIADQLYMWGSGGRVRFQTDPANWCNWAALPSSSQILSAGGLCVEFDIRYTFNTNATDWIGFAIGMKGLSGGEPLVRTTDAETDYGFKIGKDGTYTRHGNGTQIGSAVVGSSALARKVKLEYIFTSFADGSPVTVKTTVAGQVIGYDQFAWNANSGELYMELENRGSDTYFDDLKFSTATLFSINMLAEEFRSGSEAGTLVGVFDAETLLNENGFEDATYQLVSGEGSTDNSKFAINSAGQLVTGSYDFKLGEAGKVYSVRVRGTGTESNQSAEQVFTVVPIKDDDMDMLPDEWELSFPGNTSLANLTGLEAGPGPGPGTGDYDGDGIPDLFEYEIWVTDPGLSPITLDSDGDGINDEDEENPSIEGHVVTNPRLADSDRDGISDSAEYTAGTNPVEADSDGDGSRDGFELERGSDPLVYNSRPALLAGFALVPVTDDASSGISTGKTYTHKISGGAATTINDVVFDVLTPTSAPANFAWTVNGGKLAATTPNLGNWVAANGGVTGAGLQGLYNTFTYGAPSSGAVHTYELSGLTPGQSYVVKLYLRKFANNTLRPIDLTFTNGSDVKTPFGALLYDRPEVVFDNGNPDTAYYVSYSYVAQGTTLLITAANHPAVLPDSGGPHLYGLTNEVSVPAGSALKILSVSRDPSGSVTIHFSGAASTAYRVTKSSNLSTSFVPLTTPLSITTNASGTGQAVIPASEASEAKEFYRIED